MGTRRGDDRARIGSNTLATAAMLGCNMSEVRPGSIVDLVGRHAQLEVEQAAFDSPYGEHGDKALREKRPYMVSRQQVVRASSGEDPLDQYIVADRTNARILLVTRNPIAIYAEFTAVLLLNGQKKPDYTGDLV